MSIYSRRDFLRCNAKHAATVAALGLFPGIVRSDDHGGVYYVSAARIGDQQGLASYRTMDQKTQLAVSGFRGHQVLRIPGDTQKILMLGRRPERRVLAFDLVSGRSELAFETEENQHLFGHACFDAEGEHLFTTEATSKSQEGIVVVRDARDFSVVDRFSSYGVGPHQLCLSQDGKQLIVANGGILTRPESGRKALNLESMQPSLDFINLKDGRLAERHTLPERHASIRHIDVGLNGEVSVATQLQREAMSHNDVCELCALYTPSGGLNFLPAPEGLYTAMDDYVGSTVINSNTRLAGFTSPRGNVAVFWNIEDQTMAGYHRFHDVCGLAVSRDLGHFVLSNSRGEIRHLNALTLKEDKSLRQHFDNIAWDNHLAII